MFVILTHWSKEKVFIFDYLRYLLMWINISVYMYIGTNWIRLTMLFISMNTYICLVYLHCLSLLKELAEVWSGTLPLFCSPMLSMLETLLYWIENPYETVSIFLLLRDDFRKWSINKTPHPPTTTMRCTPCAQSDKETEGRLGADFYPLPRASVTMATILRESENCWYFLKWKMYSKSG